MRKYIIPILLGILVSFYIFPVQFRFLPALLNTKNVIAVIGITLFAFKCLQEHSILLTRRTIISGLIAVLFSIWCLYSITANGTSDDSYTTYWRSFLIWLSGAYCVCSFLRSRYGSITLPLLIRFLAIVCVAQCIIAVLNDNVPAIKNLTDLLVVGGPEFYDSIDRMYGFGAALDSAGVVFCVVLVLLAYQITRWRESSEGNSKILIGLLVAFVVITIVGNMMARTTTIGAVIGLVYLLFSYFRFQKGGYIQTSVLRFFAIFVLILAIFVVVGIILYNTNPNIRSDLRFAFEGFFNWAETGEFSTGSTDKLNSTMWIWPETTRGWMIGNGIFGLYEYSTDIGYCRFVLYCGIIGLSIFSMFFLYNHLAIRSKFKNSSLLALCLIALTFIIWIKVATDIFFIDALLFCIDEDPEHKEEEAPTGPELTEA